MFPDDDIRETIINYADGAGEENTVKLISMSSIIINGLLELDIEYSVYYYIELCIKILNI